MGHYSVRDVPTYMSLMSCSICAENTFSVPLLLECYLFVPHVYMCVVCVCVCVCVCEFVYAVDSYRLRDLKWSNRVSVSKAIKQPGNPGLVRPKLC